MAGLDLPVGQQLLGLERELEQPDRVRDVRAGDPHPLGELLLLESELLQECPERLGELDRAEVLAVDVLDQRLAQEVRVVGIAQDHGDGRQAGDLGRPQPALPRDQLVPVARLADHDRLQDADLPDRGRQGADLLLVPVGAGLLRVRGDGVHRHLEQPGALSPASGAPGISADNPRPSPPRFDITRLPCGTVAIGAWAPRPRPRAWRRCRPTACAARRRPRVARSGSGLGGRRIVGVLVDDHHPSFGKVSGWGRGARWLDPRRRRRGFVHVLPQLVVLR